MNDRQKFVGLLFPLVFIAAIGCGRGSSIKPSTGPTFVPVGSGGGSLPDLPALPTADAFVELLGNNQIDLIHVAYDATVAVAWRSSSNVTSCQIVVDRTIQTSRAPSGSVSLQNVTQAKSISAFCQVSDGRYVSDQLDISVGSAPPTVLLSGNDAPNGVFISPGGTVILRWSTLEATGCSLSSTSGQYFPSVGISNTAGMSIGPITENVAYQISCAGANNSSASDTVSVIVIPNPMVALSAGQTSNLSLLSGNTGTTLSFSIANVSQCQFTKDGVVIPGVTFLPTTTYATGAVTATSTYALTCQNLLNVPASASVSITVLPAVHYIFVSSATYNGNLGGLNGADAECQTLANAAAVTHTKLAGKIWKAILSTSNTHAKDRISFTMDVHKIDETLVKAKSTPATSLFSEILSAAIDQDENENFVSQSHNTWTGTDLGGVADNESTCSSWTSSSDDKTGQVGSSDANDGEWHHSSGSDNDKDCDTFRRLYCISQ